MCVSNYIWWCPRNRNWYESLGYPRHRSACPAKHVRFKKEQE